MTKHERVRTYLLGLVEQGLIRRGDTLPGEVALAAQLGVSRSTVREAMGRLASEGLIDRVKRRGTVYLGATDHHGTTRSVGVLSGWIIGGIYPELVHGIEDGLFRAGYTMVLANGNDDHAKEEQSIARMLDQGIAGLIIEPYRSGVLPASDPFCGLLRDLEIPIVTTNCVIPGLTASAVTVDDVSIGRIATEYLISRGHRRIACIMKTDTQAGILRLRGYRDAMRAAGITGFEQLVSEYSTADRRNRLGAPLTRELFDAASDPPTAVFYFNDEDAIQAYSFFEERGIRIPGQVSVVGVDNIRAAASTRPALTTVRHPQYVMGKIAAELMLARLSRGPDADGYEVRIGTRLVERESVRSIGG